MGFKRLILLNTLLIGSTCLCQNITLAHSYGLERELSEVSCEDLLRGPSLLRVRVPLPDQIERDKVALDTEAHRFSQLSGQLLSVDDFDWVSGRIPEERFFKTWQMLSATTIIPKVGDRLNYYNLRTLVDSNDMYNEVDGKIIFDGSQFGQPLQLVTKNTELENSLLTKVIESPVAVETLVFQLETDKGPIVSQIFYGSALHVNALVIYEATKWLVEHAQALNRHVAGLTIRHLHPTAEFHSHGLRRYRLYPFNTGDEKVHKMLSREFPELVINGGATVPNGHTYQVIYRGGKQIYP